MTKIEWTDETWNPTRGCSMAAGSELGGCLNCYAARNQLRRPYQTAASGKPFAILRESGPRWSGEVELVESKLTEPLHWKKPRRVFVNSMSDLFHEALSFEDISRVFAVMETCRWHTFQVLTKRAERMQEYMRNRWRRVGPLLKEQGRRPLDNVWLGVSVEDQATADERIPLLLQTPATLRFVSYEPALGPVDFSRYLSRPHPRPDSRWKLDWGIVGGESGPGARPFDVEWARETIRQFKAAGVPVFVKQIGRYPNGSGFPDHDYRKRDKKGGNWDQWPEDIRIREFPR